VNIESIVRVPANVSAVSEMGRIGEDDSWLDMRLGATKEGSLGWRGFPEHRTNCTLKHLPQPLLRPRTALKVGPSTYLARQLMSLCRGYRGLTEELQLLKRLLVRTEIEFRSDQNDRDLRAIMNHLPFKSKTTCTFEEANFTQQTSLYHFLLMFWYDTGSTMEKQRRTTSTAV
jgi:hypothetical protein